MPVRLVRPRALFRSALQPLAAVRTMASNDWSAAQYLKFQRERTRAVYDLVARVPLPGGLLPLDANADAGAKSTAPTTPLRIVDLGCGPANSTAVLRERFPGAHLTGMDSSPNMLARARQALPDVDFQLADLQTYVPPPPPAAPVDLFLANAVFQWLRHADRVPTLVRLLATQRPGGVLAWQVPDNLTEPSHRSMREVGRGEAPGTSAADPWVPQLRALSDRDPIEAPEALYDALIPHCASVDIWHGVYYHALPGGVPDLVEWLKGTGLQPFVQALPEGPVRDSYLAAYARRLADFYPPRADGSVLVRYPRLFVVAVKK